ncbi:MAG: 3'-5' exoribonuclease [Niameybacter sp.]|nr:3'-5' exoribonuclease [Niameybacter sp.]
MNFTAIDFETANEKRNSPCSLGITVVEKGQIILEKYWLIRPKEMRFSPMNIWIHGIREGDVRNALEFDALWEEIRPFLEDRLVVAHNAAFDISVLRQTLTLYGIPFPTFDYCCTMVMSRHFYSYLENAKLNTVNQHLGYSFTHHHAGADASACANILMNISKELQLHDINAIAAAVGFKLGKLFPGGYNACGTNGGGVTSQNIYNASAQHKLDYYSCTTDFFKDKIVAFTGSLSSLSRSEAISLVERCGGDYSPSVTLKTSIVVTGMKNVHMLTPAQMSTKLRRAMMLIERGQKIVFLNEDDFLELMR